MDILSVSTLTQRSITGCRRLSRTMLATGLLLLSLLPACYSECVVSRDGSGALITICKLYVPQEGLLMNRPDKGQVQMTFVYAGSPYLSYPVYEDGLLEFRSNNQKIPCKIAFNLQTNQLLCRLANDSTERAIFPDVFTIGTKRFITKTDHSGNRIYYMVLYAGKSKLLMQLKMALKLTERRPYDQDILNDGAFIRQEHYFIELADSTLRSVHLTRKSVLKALGSVPGRALPSGKKNKMTVPDVVKAVAGYDGFP